MTPTPMIIKVKSKRPTYSANHNAEYVAKKLLEEANKIAKQYHTKDNQ